MKFECTENKIKMSFSVNSVVLYFLMQSRKKRNLTGIVREYKR